MKCARCATELPGHAQFCMKCGMPVAVAPPAETAAMARPVPTGAVRGPVVVGRPSAPKTALIAAVALVLALVACGGYFGYRSLMNRTGTVAAGSNIVTAAGRAPDGSGLLNANGRIGGASRLTDTSGQPSAAPIDPTDINDYLKFLREIEQKRLIMQKRQIGRAMTLAQTATAGNLTSEMGGSEQEISSGHNATYGSIQTTIDEMSGEWDNLAKEFIAKTPPQPCQKLHDYYYEAFGKVQGSTVAVFSSFSQALGAMSANDPSKVGDVVEKLKGKEGKGLGSYSKDIDDAFNQADHELGAVCDRFHLHKDFDILPDGGSSSMFGLGG